ncbi:MAG TPA: DUF1592 domain-containing protein [Polyangiaceae bacterium]|nr:DUF1592 domain-containing protein [Polyangiaceae bacterium]
MAALGGLLACSEDEGGNAANAPAAGGSSAGSTATGGGGAVTTGGATSASALLNLPAGDTPIPRLRRLTKSELEHSLQDLLGAETALTDIETDNVVGGFASIGASSVATSPAGVSLYEGAAIAATEFVLTDATRVASRLACVPASVDDTECLTQAITGFGRRAFRRPLTELETSRFVGLVTAISAEPGSSVLAGLRHALSAILQSPSFLYRSELGVASAADGGRLKYTDFEMASRLAATLWDSVPDDVLLDAAGAGTLASPDGVRSEALRMLADPRSQRAVKVFADELYGMAHLEEASKDPALFPTWSDTLKAAMAEELEQRVLDKVFTQQGDFLSLYDEKVSFVNDELARHYGLPEQATGGFYRVEFPADSPRAGLLGSGAVLAGHALPQRTSPTSRGKFVAEALLCLTIQPPPPMVPPLPPMAEPGATLRQRLTLHRDSPACAGCHALMDPIGFGMENFDSVGLYRTLDNGSPIDASGELSGGSLDGATFTGLAELGAAIRQQPLAGPCLVSKVYAEALGRPAISLDGGALDVLAADFASNQNRLDQLLLALVESDAFRFVEPSNG